jgi:HSP20 family protein
MTSLTRWVPFRDLRRVHDMLDRAFDEGMYGNMSEALSEYEGLAPVDVFQTEEAIVVKASLPGVKPDDVDISVTGDMLTIRGEVKEEHEETDGNGKRYQIRERRYSRFSRSLTLPSTVDASKAEAEIEDGIVTLTIPKAEESKPRQITVKAKK